MINNPDVPVYLYKYRFFDDKGFYKTYLEGKLYFSSPRNFNDPFDTKAVSDYASGSDEEIREFFIQNFMFIGKLGYDAAAYEFDKVVRERGFKEIKKIVDINDATRSFIDADIGICSLSKLKDNNPMWAHYSDSHKGFCVEYHSYGLVVLLKGLQKIRLFNTPIIINEVQYKNNVPLINPYHDDSSLKVDQQFFTKTMDWAYEKEWRIINPDGVDAKLKLPSEIITGIYFGLKATKENIKEAIDISEKEIGDLKYYQAVENKKETKIEFQKINN